ncbi:tetratricopeptide repeat-containing protein [Flavisphingomonas formosensis]|uniref:tetratricopeptide repeat-containing protein n=1 Tax=Flavisphingomonas formosensis TaxID=861534 RepID=UPI0018DFBC58|nr:tetratricopeptide repeat-containing protein [Sphingomonas formosensis]
MPTSAADRLISIIAHARSGALEQAWLLFREAGLDAEKDDPAVLSVRGRLLKDRALAAPLAERKRLFGVAAESYAAAAAINGASYPLINAATLALLAGAPEQARDHARQVIARIEARPDEPETPYYRAATVAEARLLLGEVAAARDALAEGIALAPRAWEDHASTLRQFGLILDALGEDKAWLDLHRPPRSMHFAGPITVAAGDALAGAVADLIAAERIGFAFGALAAGADIVIAEAALAAGAELHVVLPGDRAGFASRSVEPFGADWLTRFDALIERAETVREIGAEHGPVDHAAIALADMMAMGGAAMQAGLLQSEAVQLLVTAEEADGGVGGDNSMRVGQRWLAAGRRQLRVTAPRTAAAPPAPALLPDADEQHHMAAMLALSPVADRGGRLAPEDLSARLAAIADALAASGNMTVPPCWAAGTLHLAFAETAAAVAAAQALARALAAFGAWRIAGHFGSVFRLQDPLTGGTTLFGPAAKAPARLLGSVPPGAIHVTEGFTLALWAENAAPPGTGLVGEVVGEDGLPVPVYALARQRGVD